MTTTPAALKAAGCPFCGNELCSIRNAGNKGVLRQVYCRDVDCGARGPARPSEDHAITAWNNRAANITKHTQPSTTECPHCGKPIEKINIHP